MKIGCPKEIKNHEYRVGLTPTAVGELVRAGHSVTMETNAGAGIGADDTAYTAAGAAVVDTAEEIFANSEMIVKVKEPQAVERKMLREGQLLYTYLHLAPDPEQTRDLIDSGAVCVAYETVTSPRGGLPLLAPMSEVAGRLSIQAGMKALEKPSGGRGLLRALLRCQHARCRAAHQHLRLEQRDPAACVGIGKQGLQAGAARRRAPA